MSFFAALVPFRFAQVYRLDSPELFLEIRRYNNLSIKKLHAVDVYVIRCGLFLTSVKRIQSYEMLDRKNIDMDVNINI